MSLSIACQHCAAKLRVPDRLAGTKAKCPQCGKVLVIPANSTTPAVKTAPPPPAPAAITAAAAETRPVVSPATVASGAAIEPVASRKGKPAPIVLLAVVGAGSLVVVVGIVAVSAFFFSPGRGDNRSPVPEAAAAKDNPRTAPAVNPIATNIASQSSTKPPPDKPPPTAAWHEHRDEQFQFRASFPAQPMPFDPTAEIADPNERKLAAELMAGRLNLKAAVGGRTYIVSAAPVQLGGTPAKTYLDRMSGAAAAVHRGFQAEQQQDIDLSGNPGKDITLRGKGQRKLLRIVVANGHVYSLLLEGDDRLAFSDADARQFFGDFAPAGAAGGVVPLAAGSETGSPPVTAAENAVAGEAIDFRIAFPNPGAVKIDTFDTIADPKQRENVSKSWPSDVLHETWALTDGDRTYAVTALCDSDERIQGRARAGNQRARFERFTEAWYTHWGKGRIAARYAPGELHGMSVQDLLITREAGGSAVVRQTQAGKYSFYVRVEGPSDLSRDDAAGQSFLSSLFPPADIPSLPAKGPSYAGAIVKAYHPIRGIELEVDGQTIAAKATPETAILDPDGLQYAPDIPNLMREIVCKPGNVVDVVLDPPNKNLSYSTIRVIQLVKEGG